MNCAGSEQRLDVAKHHGASNVFSFNSKHPILMSFHLHSQFGTVPATVEKILNLAIALRESADPIMKNLSTTLSTRQLLRIGNRCAVYSKVN